MRQSHKVRLETAVVVPHRLSRTQSLTKCDLIGSHVFLRVLEGRVRMVAMKCVKTMANDSEEA